MKQVHQSLCDLISTIWLKSQIGKDVAGCSVEGARTLEYVWKQGVSHASVVLGGWSGGGTMWHRRECCREFFLLFLFQKHKLELPGIIIPPPTPAHLYEQLISESLPLWNQFDMLPQDLLKEWVSCKLWENQSILFSLEAKKGLSSVLFLGREGRKPSPYLVPEFVDLRICNDDDNHHHLSTYHLPGPVLNN